jgi:hemerythrin
MTTLKALDQFAGNAGQLCEAVIAASKQNNWRVEPDSINERLVRYYASEGVIDRPERQGRDSTYGFRHLVQLIMARRLSHEQKWSLQLVAQYNQETTTAELDRSLFKALQAEDEYSEQAGARSPVNAASLVQKFKRDVSLQVNNSERLDLFAKQTSASPRSSRSNERGTPSTKPPMAITDVLDEVRRMKDEWLQEIASFKNMQHSAQELSSQVHEQGSRVSELNDAQRRLMATLEQMAQVGFQREQAFMQHVGQMLERHTFEVKDQLSEVAQTQRALERHASEVKAQLDEFAQKQQALIDLIEEKQKRVADS